MRFCCTAAQEVQHPLKSGCLVRLRAARIDLMQSVHLGNCPDSSVVAYGW
jgi:hypothetical protein